ncbi:sulfatase [Porticoccus sp. GXU_MW_L64]
MKHKRSLFLSLLLPALCVLASCSAEKNTEASPQQPNIILFLVDDMGPMDTSVPFVVNENGEAAPQPLNDFYRTPNMEKLAEQGVRFAHFYANSVCSPSRVSLLNGQYSARHKVTQWIYAERTNPGPEGWKWAGLSKDDWTLVSALKSADYATAHIGKAHLGPDAHEGSDPLNLHFDINIGGSSAGQPGSYYGLKDFGKGKRRFVPHLDAYHGQDIFLSEALTREATKTIDQFISAQKPFFMQMSHYALHTPFEADPRFADHYKDSGKSDKTQAFATLVEGMDKSLGDLINHLDAKGIADNTLIVFLGDNGSDAPLGGEHDHSSSAPYRGKKATHYDGGMRAPFMVSWAKPNPRSPVQQRFAIKPGIVYQDFVSIVDIVPTLLKLAGLEAPEQHHIDGQDLSSYLASHQGEHSQQFLMHFPHGHRSNNFSVFRSGDWKVIQHRNPDASPEFELFNLKDDPYENHDQASANPEKLQAILKEMNQALEQSGAQFTSKKMRKGV